MSQWVGGWVVVGRSVSSFVRSVTHSLTVVAYSVLIHSLIHSFTHSLTVSPTNQSVDEGGGSENMECSVLICGTDSE